MRDSRSRSSFGMTVMIATIIIVSLCALGYYAVQRHSSASPSIDRSIISDGSRTPVVETAPVLPDQSTATTQATCSTVTKPFVPRTVRVTGQRYAVEALDPVVRTDSDGQKYAVSPDPLNDNPSVFAWDRDSAKPGAKRGTSSLTAHTYSAGSALGNRLIVDLKPGARLVLNGPEGRVCYQVSERIELPVADFPSDRVYDMDGKHQVVITVCSGYNQDTGVWDKRTIWFAKPVK